MVVKKKRGSLTSSKKIVSLKALRWAQNASRVKPLRVKAPTTPSSAPKRFNQGWREIGEERIYFRSQWEANYGMFLQWQKEKGLIKGWEHEPKTFWFEGIKRGCVSYLPDFRVTHNDGSIEWIEVKGHMDAKSATKIKRFKKFFPEEKFRLIDSKWYKQNRQKLSLIVPMWERN